MKKKRRGKNYYDLMILVFFPAVSPKRCCTLLMRIVKLNYEINVFSEIFYYVTRAALKRAALNWDMGAKLAERARVSRIYRD